MDWTQDQINEVYLKIQRLAATDEEFRRELLENSRAAIEKIAGESLPEDFNVKVIENDPQYTATFVLPPMSPDELDDEMLDMVAGGSCLVDGCGGDACAAQGRLTVK